MLETLLFVSGVLVGVVVGGVAATLRGRAAAVAAQARADQLAVFLKNRDDEVATLRDLLEAARSRAVQAETRMEESARSLQDQRRLLDEAEEKLRAVFKSLAGDALKSSNEDFLRLAQETLKNCVDQARGDLSLRQQAIAGLVGPLAESLSRLDAQVRTFETQGREAFGDVRRYLQSVAGTQDQLQAETRKLVAALREPRTRGRWGELTLRRVVELAGMSDRCDFEEQVTADGEQGRLRPDMVIRLPGQRSVVVDAKCPMDAYLDAVSAETEDARAAALQRHVAAMRSHMNQLAAKKYWDQFADSVEMVVLFIPGESFFSAAIDCDRTLIETGVAGRVVLASPTTLIALLWAVQCGWRQEAMARNAESVRQLGRELHERIRTMIEHLGKLHRSLVSAVTSWNGAVGSLEARVLPAARKFKELGAAGGDDIGQLERIDQLPRPLPQSPDNGDESATVTSSLEDADSDRA